MEFFKFSYPRLAKVSLNYYMFHDRLLCEQQASESSELTIIGGYNGLLKTSFPWAEKLNNQLGLGTGISSRQAAFFML